MAKLKLNKNNSIPYYWFYGALSIKLIASFALIWIYTNHYEDRSKADIFKYFDDAISIQKNARNKPELSSIVLLNPFAERNENYKELIQDTQHWDPDSPYFINDNRTIILLNLILLQISGGYYLLHSIVFTLLSFSGLVCIFFLFKQQTKLPSKLIFIVTFLIPSVVLWTSGILKESWLFFNLGFFLLFLHKLLQQYKPIYFFLSFLFFISMLSIKVYVLLFILPLTLLISWKTVKPSYISGFILAGISFIFLFWSKIVFLFKEKLVEFSLLAVKVDANSRFVIKTHESAIEYLLNIPFFLFNVFIRPAYYFQLNPLSLLSMMESMFYLILLLPILFIKKPQKQNRFLWGIFIFILLTSILIGSTVPVIGAIIRYKVVIIPFYLIFVFSFYPSKLVSKYFHSNEK